MRTMKSDLHTKKWLISYFLLGITIIIFLMIVINIFLLWPLWRHNLSSLKPLPQKTYTAPTNQSDAKTPQPVFVEPSK